MTHFHHQKKLLLPVLLVAALALLLIPLFVMPASAETEGYYTYTISNGEATITDVDTAISGDVVILDTLGGYPVGRIGYEAFRDCSSLTSIEIPSSVTSIGESAFYGCSRLKSVAIPSGVTSIGRSTFEDCSALTSIDIPTSVTSIGNYAFMSCISLTSIEIPSSVTSIGYGAFWDCSSLTSIEIPSSVTSIGNYAFVYCTSLTSVTFGENSQLTSIGDSAFYDCSRLKSVAIPSGVTSIGHSVFYYCSSLTSITIPDGVKIIREGTFCSCESLSNVMFGKDSQLTIIDNDAFAYCSSLTSIEIPTSVAFIGNNAFYSCSSLATVNYGGTEAQWDAITVGDYNDPLLNANIVFAEEEEAEVVSGTCGDNLTWSLDLGTGVLTISGTGAMGDWYDETDTPWYAYQSDIKEIEMDAGITHIGEYAFWKCDSLTSVRFEENSKLTTIGVYAFCDCTSLASISLPKGLVYIDMSAFARCTALASLDIPVTVEFIGDGAFYGCSNLIQVEGGVSYVDNWVIACDRAATTISLREGTVGIAHMAFPSSIVSVTIPSSVKRINAMAFDVCLSLATVYYGGTEEEWNAIDIDECNDPLLNAKIIFAPSLSANVLLGDKFSANGKVSVPAGITATEAGLYVDGVKMAGVLTDGYYLVEGFLKTAAKETGKTVTVQAYYVADGIEVKGNAIETSIAALLRLYLADSDADVVSLATATLNYAAAAQVYFNYDVENLVNEGLAVTLPQGEYADNFGITEAMPDALVAPYEIALLLNDTVDLHVWIGAKSGATVDFSTLSLAVSANANMSGALTVAFDEDGFATVKAISPTNWNKTYYFRIVDGEGNAVSATFTYGVSTYYARMSENDDASLAALVESMMALYEANVAYLTEPEVPYIPEGNQIQPDRISDIF